MSALAAAFLFGFGEEISWGQRLIGIDVPPEIKDASSQEEINQVFHYVAKPIFEPRYQNSEFPLAHSLYETKETMVAVIFAGGAFYLYQRAKDRPEGPAEAAPEGDLWQDVILAPVPDGRAERRPGLSRV